MFCLRSSLTNCIISKLFTGKNSIKFTKLTGLQDPKIHVRKFQEESMEYAHDKDMLVKLFSQYAYKVMILYMH